MRKLIKERMENKVANFVGLNKVVLGIKWTWTGGVGYGAGCRLRKIWAKLRVLAQCRLILKDFPMIRCRLFSCIHC